MGFRNTLHRFLHWLNALLTYLVYIYNIIIRTSAVKTIWKVEMINRARAELFPGEENVLRFACLLINYSQPLILQNSFHDFALKLRVRDLRRTEEMFYLMVHFRRLSRNIKASNFPSSSRLKLIGMQSCYWSQELLCTLINIEAKIRIPGEMLCFCIFARCGLMYTCS